MDEHLRGSHHRVGQVSVLAARRKGLEREGIRYVEVPYRGPPQRSEMSAHAETVSEVVRESPDVGTRRTLHSEPEVTSAVRLVDERAGQLNCADNNRHWLSLNLATCSSRKVESFPRHFLGGEHGRSLQLRPHEFIQRSSQIINTHGIGCQQTSDLFAGTILSVRGKTKRDRCIVFFVEVHEELRKPGRTLDAQDEYSGCEGIKRTHVSDPSSAKDTSHSIDDVVRCHTLRFV